MPTDHNITAIQLPNGDKCHLPNKVKYIDITKSGSTYSLPSGTTYTSIKALIDADYICVVRVDSPGNETDGKIHLYLCNYLPTDSSSPDSEWDVGLFFESPTPYSGEAPFQIKIGTDNSVSFRQHSSGGYLSNLSDVDISSLANGQILVYNSTSQKWENSSSSETPLQIVTFHFYDGNYTCTTPISIIIQKLALGWEVRGQYVDIYTNPVEGYEFCCTYGKGDFTDANTVGNTVTFTADKGDGILVMTGTITANGDLWELSVNNSASLKFNICISTEPSNIDDVGWSIGPSLIADKEIEQIYSNKDRGIVSSITINESIVDAYIVWDSNTNSYTGYTDAAHQNEISYNSNYQPLYRNIEPVNPRNVAYKYMNALDPAGGGMYWQFKPYYGTLTGSETQVYLTSEPDYEGANTYTQHIYSDAAHTNEITPQQNAIYIDVTLIPDYKIFKIYSQDIDYYDKLHRTYVYTSWYNCEIEEYLLDKKYIESTNIVCNKVAGTYGYNYKVSIIYYCNSDIISLFGTRNNSSDSDIWSMNIQQSPYEYVGNKVNSINPSKLTDCTYPTTKAVHDYIVESSVYTITGFWDSNTYGSPIVQYSKDDLVLDLYDGIIYKIEDNYGTKSQTPYYTPYDGQVIFAERDNAYYYAFPSNTQACKVKAITKGDIYCDYVNDNNNSTYILGLYVSVCDSFGCITLDSTNSTSNSYDLLVGAKHDDSTGQYTDVYGSVHTFIIYNNKSSDVDFTLTPSSPCDSSGLDTNNTFTVPSNGKAEISILFEGDGSTRFYYSNLSFIVKTDFEIGTY